MLVSFISEVKMCKVVVFCWVLLSYNLVDGAKIGAPNIVLILADDMGSNDVSYRGSDQFTTANIDALGYNGMILDRHYTEAICTPSRAALLTGQYPSKLGMQGFPISAGEDRHLPPDTETLPSLLKNLGYSTHLVGKWHLGSARRDDTPTRRGFDTHFGYWNGYVGYFTYEIGAENKAGNVSKRFRGFDLREDFTDAWSERGTHATDLFTKKTLEVIEKQDKNVPMFLMVTHLAVHTGDDDLVEVKNETSMNETFGYIVDLERRRYADALIHLDNSIGQIIEKLQDREMLNNTIVIFMSDNGAQVRGLYHNGGSNFPLRGEKFSLHEGGIRNAAVVYSPLLKMKNFVYKHPIHITDWLPTLYGLAGGDVTTLKNKDGVDQWDNISQNKSSERKDFLVNIDEVASYSAIIGQNGRYKIINGTTSLGFFDEFSDEPKIPKTISYNISAVLNSAVNKAIQKANPTQRPLCCRTIEMLRKLSSSLRDNPKCQNKEKRKNPKICNDLCLFDLVEDPCETENLVDDKSKQDIVEELKVKLQGFWGELFPQTNKPVDFDSDPAKYNGTWCTWKDDELCVKTPVKS